MRRAWSPRSVVCCCALVAVVLAVAALQAAPPKAAGKGKAPAKKQGAGKQPAGDQIMVRVRIAEMAPAMYARIKWHWGGQGITTAETTAGELTAVPPLPVPDAAQQGEGQDYIFEKLKNGSQLWVKKGVWLPPVPLSHFKLQGLPFITFAVHGKPTRRGEAPKDVVQSCALEFEFSYQGQVIKTFKEIGPDGPLVSVVIPVRKLGENRSPTPEFLDELGGLSQYSQRRLDFVKTLPWANRPLPKKYAIVSDCFGYVGDFVAHTANKKVMLAEWETLRQLGGNGLRASSDAFRDLIVSGQGLGKDYRRARIGGTGDYLVPPPLAKVEGAGCPYHPYTISSRALKVQEAVARSLERAREVPTEEVWLLEQDEIGAFYGNAKSAQHLATCEHCQKAFRDYVKRVGYTPDDFGVKSWAEVMTPGAFLAKAKEQGYEPPKKQKGPKTVAGGGDAPADAESASDDDDDFPAMLGDFKLPVTQRGWAMLTVLNRDFKNETSAQLLSVQRRAYEAENAKKQKALAAGRKTAPEARQPWLYAYALRRTSPTMGGDTLDYFDFYRQADNGFMYETSNRDPRVWHWDSYMSDLGRVLGDKLGTRYAMCLKPHRGAPAQRALAAVSRNAKMIYWYTYGPNWSKGDSFSGQLSALRKCSWVARLIAAAEDVTYDGHWAHPAEVALVRLRTSETFESSTSWENGKWIYTALLHAHVPVDPLSESMLLDQDLSRYKVIYVSGPNIRQAAADKLAKWVEQGGTLYTSGGGLTRDEGNQPLKSMLRVLGLKPRKELEEWAKAPRYGSVGLAKLHELTPGVASAISVKGVGELAGQFPVLAAREVLEPEQGTTVLAQFSDGKVAATKHAYGKGQAYVVGFFPGVEYSVDVQTLPYDTAKSYQPAKREFVSVAARAAGVKPIVDASEAAIEGVLMKHPTSGKQAAILINWSFAVNDEKERSATDFSNLKVAIRGTGKVSKVRSAALEQDLPFQQTGDDIAVTVPTIEEGDILLLE